jgi:hypothetical protein
MKCAFCGGEKFFPASCEYRVNYITDVEYKKIIGMQDVYISAMICEGCGRVEHFLSQASLKTRRALLQAMKEQEQELLDLEEKYEIQTIELFALITKLEQDNAMLKEKLKDKNQVSRAIDDIIYQINCNKSQLSVAERQAASLRQQQLREKREINDRYGAKINLLKNSAGGGQGE